MINFKNNFWILKNDQLNISSVSQILQEQVRKLIFEGDLIFQERPNIGSPLVFQVKKDCSSTIFVKITLKCGILEIYEFYLSKFFRSFR